MKKLFIILFMLFFVLLLGVNGIKVNAAEATFYEGLKSPLYDSDYDPENSQHLGYYYGVTESGNTRTATYSDIFLGNQFKISYAGVLSSQQPTMQRSILYIEQASINKMSFFMTEEFYHTSALTLSVTAEINDIEAGIGVTWSKTTRYAEGVKITTDVSNDYTAPFVIMVLYKIDARVSEVAYRGVSTKSSGSWGSYSWNYEPVNIQSKWATIGYVAHYAFVGADDLPNYETGQYLIDENSYFNDSELFFAGD